MQDHFIMNVNDLSPQMTVRFDWEEGGSTVAAQTYTRLCVLQRERTWAVVFLPYYHFNEAGYFFCGREALMQLSKTPLSSVFFKRSRLLNKWMCLSI